MIRSMTARGGALGIGWAALEYGEGSGVQAVFSVVSDIYQDILVASSPQACKSIALLLWKFD